MADKLPSALAKVLDETTIADDDLWVSQDVNEATAEKVKSVRHDAAKKMFRDLLRIADPDFRDVQHMQDVFHSTGLVSTLNDECIVNNRDGSVTAAAGQGLIRGTNSPVAPIYFCEWAEDASVSLTDNSINYISAQFVNTSTNPTIVATTTLPTDLNKNILLGSVYRRGIDLQISNALRINVSDHASKMIQRMHGTSPFARESGGALSETGILQIATSAGLWWEGLNQFVTIAQDTSGASPDDNHTFDYFYQDGGGGWTTHESDVAAVSFTGSGLNDATSGGTFVGSHTLRIHVEIDGTGAPDTFKWSYKDDDGVTVIETTGVSITGGAQSLVDGATITFAATTGHTSGDAWDFDLTLSDTIDNTQYDDGSGSLATLNNNQYGLHWVYLDVHGHISVLFGRDSYTLSGAEDAPSPSSVPPEFEVHSRLIGRIIIQKSSATFLLIENNYAGDFGGSVATSHSDLTDLNTGDPHTNYIPSDGTRVVEWQGIAFGDEASDLTTGLAKATFHMPNYATELLDVIVGVTDAPTGSVATFDLNEAGATVLTTKVTIDAGEFTSEDAATPPVIGGAGPLLAANAKMTVDTDGVGTTNPGKGGKIYIRYKRV